MIVFLTGITDKLVLICWEVLSTPTILVIKGTKLETGLKSVTCLALSTGLTFLSIGYLYLLLRLLLSIT